MRKSWLDGFGPRVFQTKSKEEYIQGMTNYSVQLNTGNDIESGEMRREAERKRLWQSVRHDKRVGFTERKRDPGGFQSGEYD